MTIGKSRLVQLHKLVQAKSHAAKSLRVLLEALGSPVPDDYVLEVDFAEIDPDKRLGTYIISYRIHEADSHDIPDEWDRED